MVTGCRETEEEARRVGEMLKETELAKGTLKQGNKLPQCNDVTTEDTAPTLSEIGITKRQSDNILSMKSACRDCHAETTISNQSAKDADATGAAC